MGLISITSWKAQIWHTSVSLGENFRRQGGNVDVVGDLEILSFHTHPFLVTYQLSIAEVATLEKLPLLSE